MSGLNFLKIAASLCLSFNLANARVVISETHQKITYDIEIEDLKIEEKEINGELFQQGMVSGVKGFEGILYLESQPYIPVVRLYADVNSAEDIKVEVLEGENFADKVKYRVNKLIPVIRSTEKSSSQKITIKYGDGFKEKKYPPLRSNYTVEKVGSIRGKNRYLVTLFPVHYLGAEKALVLDTRLFSVEIKKAEVSPSETLVWSKVSDKNITDLFLVGEKFSTSKSLKNYLKYKNKFQNAQSKTITINAKLKPEEIRNIIKSEYERSKNTLQFVTIIGDAEDITTYDAYSTYKGTDHYYSSIDTNDYDTDIDTPDLYLGRISVKNEKQLKSVLEKNIRYLKLSNKSNALALWSTKLTFIASDDLINENFKKTEAAHNYVINNYTAQNGFTGNFPEKNIAGGDQLYAVTYHASEVEVLESINQGRVIINYSGHGEKNAWLGPEMTQEDIRKLSSKAMPFVIANACLTADFSLDESFAETWLREKNGAIAYWGSTSNTYWDEDEILEKKIYDGIFSLNQKIFGSIVNFGLAEVWKYYGGEGKSKYYWEAYHFLGDPSLKIVL